MIIKKDLSNKPSNARMVCLACDAEYSANPNDYFQMADDDTFSCGCGSNELVIAVLKTSFEVLKD